MKRPVIDLKIFFVSFQYQCCTSFGIDTDRTAHMLAHYIKMILDELRNNINVYTSGNILWIKKVGSDFF